MHSASTTIRIKQCLGNNTQRFLETISENCIRVHRQTTLPSLFSPFPKKYDFACTKSTVEFHWTIRGNPWLLLANPHINQRASMTHVGAPSLETGMEWTSNCNSLEGRLCRLFFILLRLPLSYKCTRYFLLFHDN